MTKRVPQYFHSLIPDFLLRLWKQAIQYADLVLQFALSIALSFLAAHYLGEWMGWTWLPIVTLVLVAPTAFYRLWLTLEKLNANS